jgi:ubiquinone/menaquinone biosynthesis C-methylase UbiE
MTQLIKKIEPFDKYVLEYDQWFDNHPAVFKSEVEALREMMPYGDSHGIEVGLGTGRFSIELGIKEGVEPSFNMRRMAIARGVEVMDAVAEKLPYKDLHFDFVLMASCISYFFNMKKAFMEANRVLKRGGNLIIGFIERDSLIGELYEEKRQRSRFYRQANFYSLTKVLAVLKDTQFHDFTISQTLFGKLDNINEYQASRPGYGEGSFVVVKAVKK